MISERSESVAALLDSSGLPEQITVLVGSLVKQTSLWPREQTDLARELISHFQDGLDNGRSVEELILTFGPTDVSARLMARGKRRGRSLTAVAGHYAPPAVVVTLLLVVPLYGWSSARLYSEAPTISWRKSVDGPEASRRAAVQTLWGKDSDIAAAARKNVEILAQDARAARARRDDEQFLAGVAKLMQIAERLGDADTLQPELARMEVIEETVRLIQGRLKFEDRPLKEADRERLNLTLAEIAPNGAVRLRISLVSAAWSDLLPRLFSNSGRLTGEGLRLLQALAGKHEPGVTARILEPAYFIDTANRAEVEGMANALLNPSGPKGRDLRKALVKHREGSAWPLRLFPLTLLMPRVVEGVESSSRTNAMLQQIKNGFAS